MYILLIISAIVSIFILTGLSSKALMKLVSRGRIDYRNGYIALVALSTINLLSMYGGVSVIGFSITPWLGWPVSVLSGILFLSSFFGERTVPGDARHSLDLAIKRQQPTERTI